MRRHLNSFTVLLAFVGLVLAFSSVFVIHRGHVWAEAATAPVHTTPAAGAHAACQQAAPPPATSLLPNNIIDGAVHPELIPDVVAYRLFFVTVAEPPDASARQLARERAFLRAAGLADADIAPAEQVLANFKLEYDRFIKTYNQLTQQAISEGRSPDFTGLVLERDQLVEATRVLLESTISPDEAKRFEAHMQSEKRNMRVSKEDQ